MDIQTWTVPPEQAGERLDKVLAGLDRVGSRSRARKVLASGKVTVDERPVGGDDGGSAVSAGAVVRIAWSKPGTSFDRHAARSALDQAGLSVLYQDRWLVAVDKPVGLLTDYATRAQARDEDSVRSRVHALVKTRGDRAWVVHRIDRDTTGVVLLAKTEAAHDHLRGQFRVRRPERVYRTLLHGHLQGEQGTWAHWMAWNGGRLIQEPVSEGHPRGVHAQADWRVIERFRGCDLVEVRLHTGRRNQIRLHALLEGHPLVGETLYVQPEHDPPRALQHHRQVLHAAALTVDHPQTGAEITFEAPDPPDLADLLRRLRR